MEYMLNSKDHRLAGHTQDHHTLGNPQKGHRQAGSRRPDDLHTGRHHIGHSLTDHTRTVRPQPEHAHTVRPQPENAHTVRPEPGRRKRPGAFVSARIVAFSALALFSGCAGKTACLETPVPSLACAPEKLFQARKPKENNLEVTAMAYTARSVGKSGKGVLPRAANGQLLTPDSNAIAVSPDLFEHGLTFDKKIRIDGLEGEFTVMDTMAARHNKTIDIYFGNDHAAARQWGSRTLTISWE